VPTQQLNYVQNDGTLCAAFAPLLTDMVKFSH